MKESIPNPNWVTPTREEFLADQHGPFPLTRPDGYYLLSPGRVIEKGDFWFRPCDLTWVETGVAHWGLRVKLNGEYARKLR